MGRIAVECAACSHEFSAKSEMAGRRVKCPSCGQAVKIPKETPSDFESASRPDMRQKKKPSSRGLVGIVGGSLTIILAVVALGLRAYSRLNRGQPAGGQPQAVASSRETSQEVRSQPAPNGIFVSASFPTGWNCEDKPGLILARTTVPALRSAYIFSNSGKDTGALIEQHYKGKNISDTETVEMTLGNQALTRTIFTYARFGQKDHDAVVMIYVSQPLNKGFVVRCEASLKEKEAAMNSFDKIAASCRIRSI